MCVCEYDSACSWVFVKVSVCEDASMCDSGCEHVTVSEGGCVTVCRCVRVCDRVQ